MLFGCGRRDDERRRAKREIAFFILEAKARGFCTFSKICGAPARAPETERGRAERSRTDL